MKTKVAILFATAAILMASASPAKAGNSVTPTPPPAIPTPALLPGLIGMGLGIWRKKHANGEDS